MEITCIHGIDYDCNIYLIKGKNPTIIDCGTGLHEQYVEEEIKKRIRPAEIKQIIITHEHFDHCGGVKKLFEFTCKNAKIFAYVEASPKIEKGDSDFASMLGGVMPKMAIHTKLKDGDKIKIGDEDFIVISTPGHTPGCICLYSKESKTLFSGDTVFPYGSFGRYDFPEGSLKQLKESIERLSKLDISNIYPGHESTIEGNGNKNMKMTLENVRKEIL